MELEPKIRVMHLINSYSMGGAEKLVFDLVKALDQKSFEIFVCSIGSRGDAVEASVIKELEGAGIKTLCLHKPFKKKRVHSIFKLRRLLLDWEIQFLHTHCSSPDFYGRTAAFLAGSIPVYTTIHSMDGYYAWRERCFQFLTYRYVAISRTVESYMQHRLGIAGERIIHIPNGIQTHAFKQRPDAKAKLIKILQIKGKPLFVTHIGRIVRGKGALYLLEALKNMQTQRSDLHLLLVGDESFEPIYVNQLKRYIKRHGMEGKVFFLGVRRDIPEILSATDIFVFPSLQEGFSITVLEAMASRIPLIASDVGSIREVIEHRESGWIVPKADAKALEQALLECLQHPNKAKDMAQRANQTVMAHYRLEETVKGYAALYAPRKKGGKETWKKGKAKFSL